MRYLFLVSVELQHHLTCSTDTFFNLSRPILVGGGGALIIAIFQTLLPVRDNIYVPFDAV
jgi:hypothetical protein